MRRLIEFFRYREPLAMLVGRMNQNCFCGAAFQIEVPMVYHPLTGDTEYLMDIDAARDTWHQGHLHQGNPSMAAIVDFGSTEAISDLEPMQSFGFKLP